MMSYYKLQKIIILNILLNSKINIRFKAKYVMFITSPKMFYRIKSIFRKGVDNSAN